MLIHQFVVTASANPVDAAADKARLTLKRQVPLAGWRSSVLHHLTDVSQCRVQHRLSRSWHRLAHAGNTRTDEEEHGRRVRSAAAFAGRRWKSL
jgi:hypothetical protein